MYKVTYIDEQAEAIRVFQRYAEGQFEVVALLPEKDLDELLDLILESGTQALIVDFKLNEYKEDISYNVSYNGVDVVEGIRGVKAGFPSFVLTSYDDDATGVTHDVNLVYPKELLNPQLDIAKTKFSDKIKLQIEHYLAEIEKNRERHFQLAQKSERDGLSVEEEEELLALDDFIARSLGADSALPGQRKSELAMRSMNELLASTRELIDELKSRRQE